MLPLLFLSHSERDVIFGCWIKLNSNLKYLQILHFIDLSRYNLSAFCDVIKCLFKCILLPNGLRYHHHTHTHTHMFIYALEMRYGITMRSLSAHTHTHTPSCSLLPLALVYRLIVLEYVHIFHVCWASGLYIIHYMLVHSRYILGAVHSEGVVCYCNEVGGFVKYFFGRSATREKRV